VGAGKDGLGVTGGVKKYFKKKKGERTGVCTGSPIPQVQLSRVKHTPQKGGGTPGASEPPCTIPLTLRAALLARRGT
jgi:hypothetical protein